LNIVISKQICAIGVSSLFLLVLDGCAPMPPYNFSLVAVSPSPTAVPYDLKSTVVTLASPSEQTGPIPPDASNAVPIWQSALQDAMDRSAVFSDPAPASADLECKILKIDIPSFGASMTTDISAQYQVIDRSSGQIVYEQTVDTPGTVPMGYSFLGIVRAKESVNVAAQNNIGAFLLAFEKSQLALPRRSVLNSQ